MPPTTEPAASSRSQEGKAARRRRVIEVAMLMANEGGYEAVQMREVAERADVSLGTIYRYFNGKDDLLLAGLFGWVGSIGRRIAAEPPVGGTPADRLSAMLAEAARQSEGAPVLMGALITALGTTDPDAAEYKLAVESEVQQLMVTAIGDDPDIDVLGVSRVVGHVWLSAITRWVGGLAPAGSVEEELRHAVHMLVGRKAGAAR